MTQRRIAVCFITQDQEFQLLQAADAQQTAKHAGLEIDIAFAASNQVTQIQQISSFITSPEEKRPAAILVEPVTGETHETMARRVVGAGVGWVLLNAHANYINGLRKEHPNLPIFAVLTDQIEIGRIQARQFRKLLPNGGEILYVKQGPFTTKAAADRLAGMEQGIRGAGIKVHTTVSDWTEAGAERAVDGWYRMRAASKPPLDLVGCQNDSQAQGARRALLRHRPEWAGLPFTGCDGTPEGGQRLVKSGLLRATVITPSSTGPAIELVAQSLSTGQATPPARILTPKPFP